MALAGEFEALQVQHDALLTSTRQQSQRLTKQNSEKDEAINTLRAEMEAVKAEHDALKGSSQKTQANRLALAGEFEALQEKYDELVRLNSQQIQRVNQLTQKNSHKEQELAAQLTQKKRIVSKYNETIRLKQQQFQQLKRTDGLEKKTLLSEITALKKDNEGLKQQVQLGEQCKKDLADLQRSIADGECEGDMLSEYSAIKAEYEKLRNSMLSNLGKILSNKKPISNKRIGENLASHRNELEELKKNYNQPIVPCTKFNLRDLLKFNRPGSPFLRDQSTIDDFYSDIFGGVANMYLRMKRKGSENSDKKFIDYNSSTATFIHNLPSGGIPSEKSREYSPKFKKVFDENSTTATIYTELKPQVTRAIDLGFNMVVMGYGQSGSGKTYTVLGDEKNNGLLYYTLQTLLDKKCTINYSIIQYYLKKNYDIISMSDRPNRVFRYILEPNDQRDEKFDTKGGDDITSKAFPIQPNDTYHPDAENTRPMSSISDLSTILEMIRVNRFTRSTKLNNESSRSHLFVKLYVTTPDGINFVITFIDLAGNEKAIEDARDKGILRAREGLSIIQALGDMKPMFSSYAKGDLTQKYKTTSSRDFGDLFLRVLDPENKDIINKLFLFLNTHTYYFNDKDKNPLMWSTGKDTFDFAKTLSE